MAFNAGRRFSIARSSSHAMMLGDAKGFANRAGDYRQNSLDPSSQRILRARNARRSGF